ncbi:MAG: hypothetical protein KF754_10825 [Planctomycetes bacterium]|nr:hypothetical protein [Planctomycetota bacterium]
MNSFAGEADAWVRRALLDARAEHRSTAFWHLGVAVVSTVAWFVGTTGVYGTPYFILGFAGIPFPFHPVVFGGLWVLAQNLVYPFVRRRPRPGYVFARAADTDEIVAQGPPRQSADAESFGQDHGFSFLRSYAGVYFYAQIAMHEAWRGFAAARAVRRLDAPALARLVELLTQRPGKVPFSEISKAMPDADLPGLLAQAVTLPGIHIHTQEPQGISLTDAATEAVLVSGVA